MLRGVVCVLLGYKVRVLSYASGAFPCIVRVGVSVLHVALLRVFLGDWVVGLVTKAHFPIVRSMGAHGVPHRQAPEHFMIELQGLSCCRLDSGSS